MLKQINQVRFSVFYFYFCIFSNHFICNFTQMSTILSIFSPPPPPRPLYICYNYQTKAVYPHPRQIQYV